MNSTIGTLYIVATPIGHLDDISRRAIEVLHKVDLILAEDTRHSGKLMQHYGVQTPMQSCHEHNERDRITDIIDRLKQGQNIALISDAGTPLISDPGYHLVASAHAANIPVSPIPGPSALIAALSAAGIATDSFTFIGYLPPKSMARRQRLQALATVAETLVIFEAPHRIIQTLTDLLDLFGATREVTLCRELTKRFETIRKGTLEELGQMVQADSDQQKGEFVLVIQGAPKTTADEAEIMRVLRILLLSVPVKAAATIAAELLGESKNRLYALALKLKNK